MSTRAKALVGAVTGLALGAALGWLTGWLVRSDNSPFFVRVGRWRG
jgi:NhaP-type Na+/H+ or K+/H+ antiporter